MPKKSQGISSQHVVTNVLCAFMHKISRMHKSQNMHTSTNKLGTQEVEQYFRVLIVHQNILRLEILAHTHEYLWVPRVTSTPSQLALLPPASVVEVIESEPCFCVRVCVCGLTDRKTGGKTAPIL